jgi:hypothetical protein
MGSNRRPDDPEPLHVTAAHQAVADAIVARWREERAMNPHLIGEARGEILLDGRLGELIAEAIAAAEGQPRAGGEAADRPWLVRELARRLCELGLVPDPRLASHRPVSVQEVARGPSHPFEAEAHDLTADEAEAVVAAYRAARAAGAPGAGGGT